MEHLDYVEQRVTRTMEVLRKSYDDLHERAYKFATVLVAGGGAAGAFVLGKYTIASPPIMWAPLSGLALSWFGTAAFLIWSGTTSRELSPGNGPENLLGYFDGSSKHLGGVHTLLPRERIEALALDNTRRAELALEQQRINAYQQGCIERAEAIDMAYKAAAICSPGVPALLALVCLWR